MARPRKPPCIKVKCVGCGQKKEIPLGGMEPFCEFCGSPMIAVGARS